MKRWIFIMMLVLSGVITSECRLSAQSKSISTIWSLEGIGIGYEYFTVDGDFVQIDLKAETNDIFIKLGLDFLWFWKHEFMLCFFLFGIVLCCGFVGKKKGAAKFNATVTNINSGT